MSKLYEALVRATEERAETEETQAEFPVASNYVPSAATEADSQSRWPQAKSFWR